MSVNTMASAQKTYPELPETLLIISLKMYFTPSRTLTYLRNLLDPQNAILPANPTVRSKLLLALIPDFLTIYPCSEILRAGGSSSNPSPPSPPSIYLGAQDCFWEPTHGAFTGEVCAADLRALGCAIVELGHAERRSLFAESDHTTAAKARAASAVGLVPLVCIGEIAAPGPGVTVQTAIADCATQVRAVLDVLDDAAPVIFAYEPVWAIGKPSPASVEHVAAVVRGIRGVIEDCRGGKQQGADGQEKGQVRVLYGGSAGPGLWGAGGLGEAVDGMFLGRFAHEVEGVSKVVKEVEESIIAKSS